MGMQEYSIHLLNRQKIMAEGVTKVDSYDEEEVLVETRLGFLVIKGEGLHITNLNLEEEKLEVEGLFLSLEYIEDKGAKLRSKSKGILNKLLR